MRYVILVAQYAILVLPFQSMGQLLTPLTDRKRGVTTTVNCTELLTMDIIS